MDGEFFKELLLQSANKVNNINKLSQITGVQKAALDFFIDEEKCPLGEDLEKILKFLNLSERDFRLQVGSLSFDILDSFRGVMLKNDSNDLNTLKPVPDFKTKQGELYNLDCISLLKSLPDCSIDMIFADPPFNLSKIYPSKINDSLSPQKYIRWSEKWLTECCRVLKYGGSFFIWNLPKWNYKYASILNEYLLFRHWIAVEIKHSLPIPQRLYPSHYSLLYFIKGKSPNVFRPDRLEMDICRKCYNEIKDYGGYKNKMNPLGINLTDVWHDIYPVRHSSHKKRKGSNELSIKLLDRVIQMASNEGDIILDPFGGSGTTFIVSEIKNRRWIGSEIGPIDIIKGRFMHLAEEDAYLKDIRSKYNHLFSEETYKMRISLGLWTPENFKFNSQLEYDDILLKLIDEK